MRIKYFAYGSCMSFTDILNTTPSAEFVAVVTLEHYGLHFPVYAKKRKGGVANVFPQEGSTVTGILWEVDETDTLDIREDHPRTYQRTMVNVTLGDNSTQEALTYHIPNHLHLRQQYLPSTEYWSLLREGELLGVPSQYFDNIQKFHFN